MTVQIRNSTIDDFAAVEAILARSYPKLLSADYAPSVLVTALPLISRAQPKLLSGGTYYVAVENGRVLAAGGWSLDRMDLNTGYVRHVVTDDRYLRRGLATQILEKCFAQSSARGVRALECWSTHTAVPFYEAMKFIVDGPMLVPLGGGIAFPAVRMRRDV